MLAVPANEPELSCGNEVPQRRNPVRAWQVKSDSSWLFRACKIVDGWFRQLERLVRPPRLFESNISISKETELIAVLH